MEGTVQMRAGVGSVVVSNQPGTPMDRVGVIVSAGPSDAMDAHEVMVDWKGWKQRVELRQELLLTADVVLEAWSGD